MNIIVIILNKINTMFINYLIIIPAVILINPANVKGMDFRNDANSNYVPKRKRG